MSEKNRSNLLKEIYLAFTSVTVSAAMLIMLTSPTAQSQLNPLLHHRNHQIFYTQHISFPCLQTHVSISCRSYWCISFLYGRPSGLPELTVSFFLIYRLHITTLYWCSYSSHHEHWCRRMFPFIQMLFLRFPSKMDALLLLIVEVWHVTFAMIPFFKCRDSNYGGFFFF